MAQLPFAIIFPHVFKTGGTSLKRAIGDAIGETVTVKTLAKVMGALQRKSSEQRRALALVAGHFRFDEAVREIEPMLGRPARYVATVRDPIARLKSIYRYRTVHSVERGTPPEKIARFLRAPYDADLNVVAADWLRSGAWRDEQCMTICGEPSAEAAIGAIERRYLAAATTPSVNALASAIAGRPLRPLHCKRLDLHLIELDPGLEAGLRAVHAEDDRLFRWVQANESRLLAHLRQELSQTAI